MKIFRLEFWVNYSQNDQTEPTNADKKTELKKSARGLRKKQKRVKNQPIWPKCQKLARLGLFLSPRAFFFNSVFLSAFVGSARLF